MKTLKPTSCSPIAITIANRSHMRHTSSQARQLDPLREARGRLRGSRPPGGCNACPLKRGAVLGSPGRGWRRSAIPSFFSPFSGDVQLSTHAHECKKPGRGSHGTARARIQYHGCLVRGEASSPESDSGLPAGTISPPLPGQTPASSTPDSACARKLPLEPKLKMDENAFALPSISGNAPEIHSQ